jgi:hypothetical protein
MLGCGFGHDGGIDCGVCYAFGSDEQHAGVGRDAERIAQSWLRGGCDESRQTRDTCFTGFNKRIICLRVGQVAHCGGDDAVGDGQIIICQIGQDVPCDL